MATGSMMSPRDRVFAGGLSLLGFGGLGLSLRFFARGARGSEWLAGGLDRRPGGSDLGYRLEEL